MVYIQSWQKYQEEAEALYAKSPNKTRYCVKWRASEGKLVLKITDNETCLKYKTHSSIFLNRFEALNLSLMQKMQNMKISPIEADLRPKSPLGASKGKTGPGSRSGTPQLGTTSQVLVQGGVVDGGVKKKKPNKKKK